MCAHPCLNKGSLLILFLQTTESPAEPSEPKKPSGKASKAQRRAQQAEFNRQLWQQAWVTSQPLRDSADLKSSSEGPQDTNYFLESRNVVPLRSEFKPPPILLSRKGPSTKTPKPLTDGLNGLSLQGQESSSDDEDEKKQPTLAERQAQAAKDREEKQRKYEERRQELFGSAGTATNNGKPGSGKSSPSNLTPPSSRSATPNRGRGNGRGRGGRGGNSHQHTQSRPQSQVGLFEPSYSPKPDSTYLARRENGTPKPGESDIRPQRTPKGPDGTGRGGFGFAVRGGGTGITTSIEGTTLETT